MVLVFFFVLLLVSFFTSVVFDFEAFFTVSFLVVSFFLAVVLFLGLLVSLVVFLADDVEDEPVEAVLEEVSDDELLEEAFVIFAVVDFLAVDFFAVPPPAFARQNAFTFAPLERT